MAAYIYIAFLFAAVHAAPPATPRLYTQHPSPAQLQQINPYEYYLENAEVPNYYSQAQQKQGNANQDSNGAPSRLETLEPDSEVELIPGAQQPQPPQQTPVSPNIPGLVPGQRVFIVHMPVPGYRPGSIGGYQPVYIVAAAPQGNAGFNGYQNAILLDPSGQAVISPLLGYPRQGIAGLDQGANPGVLLNAPLNLNRPFGLAYQDPILAYQPGVGPDAARGSVRLSQFVGLQGQNANPANNARPINNQSAALTESKGQQVETNESKESREEARRNVRPVPGHPQQRNKA